MPGPLPSKTNLVPFFGSLGRHTGPTAIAHDLGNRASDSSSRVGRYSNLINAQSRSYFRWMEIARVTLG